MTILSDQSKVSELAQINLKIFDLVKNLSFFNSKAL
jgi:hypothetical protein